MGALMRLHNYYFILFAAVLLCAVSHAGVIYNGNFEIALEQGVPDNHWHPFYPPEGWQRENYAAILNRFVPDYNEGNYEQWRIDTQKGLQPIEGLSFVLLTTDDLIEDPKWALIEQEIYVEAGQTMSGYYFFGTLDYLPYPDWASITMVPIDLDHHPRSIILVNVNVQTVGSYSSTEGWVYFEYTFSAEEEGGYHLIIRVDDYFDERFTSYFAIDGLTLCDTHLDGDINRDCKVNFKDFSWLATDWLENCSDPDYFSDPQSNCYRGTDLNDDGPVDLNDLKLLSDSWML
jgi:hypothetical protein